MAILQWPASGDKYSLGCAVEVMYVTAVAAGQSQQFYPGVGIFNWHYPSSLLLGSYNTPYAGNTRLRVCKAC